MFSYVQGSFIGGEISAAAQGDVAHPDYRKSLNVCLNHVVMDNGSLQRRPGTQHCQSTRLGQRAKLLTWDFKTAFRHSIEATDGIFRFRRGTNLVLTNDPVLIVSISAAQPAVVTTNVPHTWATGNSVVFGVNKPLGMPENAGINLPLLQNRLFLITVLSPTTFSLRDGVGGSDIDGSTLGSFVAPGSVSRILELGMPYLSGSWASLRLVQANLQAVLLNGTAPQVLSVTQQPSASSDAVFALTAANLKDGPYLDAFPGSQITSSALNGVVTLTLTFQPYDATRAYNIGDYVLSGGQGYRSLTNANQGNAPPAAQWLAVNGGDPINGGAGFTSADIGRHVRLFSEPQLWDATTAFASLAVVAYQVGSNSVASYWKNTSGGVLTGVVPGTTTQWSALVPGAIWTWAKVLGVANTGVVSPTDQFGSLSGGGGVTVLFDGSPSKAFASAANTTKAQKTAFAWAPVVYATGSQVQYQKVIYQKLPNTFFVTGGSSVPVFYETQPPPGNPLWVAVDTTADMTITGYGGGHYAAAKAVQSVTVYPPTDLGFAYGSQAVGINLRAKATLPSSSSDGTLLGSTGFISNVTSPVFINSNDNATAWNYIWIEVVGQFNQPLPDDGSHVFNCKIGIAQIIVYSPNVANGSQITAQILGDALLYSGVAIRTWRLGAYGGSTGWPLCGTYYDNRLWLSGAIDGRVDASVTGDFFNFAPTAPSGAVALSNAIAVTTTDSVNPIYWMEPHEQGVICGSSAGEFLVAPAATSAGLGPGNVTFRRRTTIGCANIEPRRTDHTLLFVQRYQRDIQEYFADVFSGKFSSPSLEEQSRHTTFTGINEIAYQQKLASVVWARLQSGNLVGVTYRRNTLSTARGPDAAAHHRHTLGHGRPVISMCIASSTDGAVDALQIVTRDGLTGLHHVELMTNLLDEGAGPFAAWLLDDAIAPTSFSISQAPQGGAPYGGLTLNGLWSHNGKTVQAYVCGIDCGSQIDNSGRLIYSDFAVSNGSIFIPFGDGVNAGSGRGKFTAALVLPFVGQVLPAVVGFTYNSDGQIVRAILPQESGARAGAAFGKLQRYHYVSAHLYGVVSRTISLGVDFGFGGLAPIKLLDTNEAEVTVQINRGLIVREDVEGDQGFDGMPCWRISRPYPAMINAIGGFLETVDV